MKQKMKWLSSPVEPEFYRQARIEAAKSNVSLAEFIRRAVHKAVEEKKEQTQHDHIKV